MEKEPQQSRFDGRAIVEIFGHQRYAGFVTTESFGQAVLFRIDVPKLEPRQRTTKAPGYHPATGTYIPPGTAVDEGEVAGYTKLFGAGAIYAITPCTQEAALKAVESIQPRPWMKVTFPPERAIADGADAATGETVDFDDIDQVEEPA